MQDFLDGDGELIEAIGKVAALSLSEAFGGTRLYVPLSLKDNHSIVRAIGRKSADLLSQRFAPDIIRIPLLIELRDTRFKHERRTNAWIARTLVMTEGGVERVVKRLKTLDKPLWP